MFDRVMKKPLGQYVWELVFGKFHSFFYKFIGYIATQFKQINYMQLLSNLTVQLLLIVFYNSNIHENQELYFHTQWPLAHNDVTKLLRLLHYFYVCYCFVFATLKLLTIFAMLICDFQMFYRTPCLVYIFMAGKQIPYMRRRV